jgi:hypothetical protein
VSKYPPASASIAGVSEACHARLLLHHLIAISGRNYTKDKLQNTRGVRWVQTKPDNFENRMLTECCSILCMNGQMREHQFSQSQKRFVFF